MPMYKQVAQLTLGSMIEETDRPQTVDVAESLKDAAAKVRGAPAGAVVVTDQGRAVGVLTGSDIAEAVAKADLTTPVSELIALKPFMPIPEEAVLEEVPARVGEWPIVVVTDAAGSPRAVMEREALADRIRNRFGTSS